MLAYLMANVHTSHKIEDPSATLQSYIQLDITLTLHFITLDKMIHVSSGVNQFN